MKTAARPKNRGTLLAILLFFLLLPLGGGVLLVMTALKTAQNAKIVADGFLTDIETVHFDDARSVLTESARKEQPAEAFPDLVERAEVKFGKLLRHSVENVKNSDGITKSEHQFTEYAEKGSFSVKITTVRENDGWKVQAFRFEL